MTKTAFRTILSLLFLLPIRGFADCQGDIDAYTPAIQTCNSTPYSCPTWSLGDFHVEYKNLTGGGKAINCMARECATGLVFVYNTIGQLLPECTADAMTASILGLNYEKPKNACGSIIQTENKVLGESIPITGAPFSLSYFSNWVQGRVDDYRVKIGVSGAFVRSGVTGYDVKIYNEVGAQVYTGFFSNSPSQSFYYTWNGLDSASNLTWGRLPYQVVITENAPDFSPVTINNIKVGGFKAIKLGVGGWVPSIWHFYDQASGTLFNGDGSTRKVASTVSGSEYFVPEEDGSVIYFFDSLGRITQTKTGITGTAIYAFAYDSYGSLSSITEPFGLVTTFTRNSSGVLTSIVAPNGKTTTVGLKGIYLCLRQ